MKILKFVIVVCFITGFAHSSFSAEAGPCFADTYTTDLIKEAREDKAAIEIRLQDKQGKHVGSLFASPGKELVGQTMYVCGGGDNYFYVNSSDIRQWVSPEVAEWKLVSAIRTHHAPNDDIIHHDEALASASVETLEITPSSAHVRMVFLAWNFANEAATNGEFYFQIPMN